jgi:hypothetical protein
VDCELEVGGWNGSWDLGLGFEGDVEVGGWRVGGWKGVSVCVSE